jgi:anti-anti-sigma factor
MSCSVGTVLVRTSPPYAHVLATGELDIATTPVLSAQLSEAVAAGCRSFRIDLAGVTFCDASTVGVLVSLDRRVRAAGGSMRIVAASARVHRILHLLDLDRLVRTATVVDDESLAHRSSSVG